MTRDSISWWFVIAGAVLTALTTHFKLLHAAFPSMPATVDAQIELLAMVVGVIAGVMRMSPLPISKEGRVKAIRADHSAAPPSAKKAVDAAEEAVVATAAAADAADVAHDDAVKTEDASHAGPDRPR